MTTAWHGDVRLGVGWGLFSGLAGEAEPHAHHAVQVLLAESPQWVWTRQRGRLACAGVVVGAGVEHRVEPTAIPVTMLYLAPESAIGRRIGRVLVDGVRVLDAQRARAVLGALRERVDGLSIVAAMGLIGAPVGETDAGNAVVDVRIQRLLEALPEVLPDGLTAALLAKQVGLSESRFRHMFTAHTGMPLRPYLRWRRLLTAISRILDGDTLTDAAVEAGFADSAHFTRTFRRHFGIAPRVLTSLRS